MVHGDDFTALGTDESLDKCEKGLKASFECKFRGRLGLDEKDIKEIRLLNRIVRITDHALRYEADPRHAELLAKSMGLIDCKSVATPRLKPVYEKKCHHFPISDDHELVSVIAPPRRREARITFKEEIETHDIVPYSPIYGCHPSQLVFDNMGKKIIVKDGEDPHTGIPKTEMKMRMNRAKAHSKDRARILRPTPLDEAAWEIPTSELIMKASPKKFKQKRIGAKAAKKAERFESSGKILN